MTILFILFIAQFSIACACLAFNSDQQKELAEREWKMSTVENHYQLQKILDCCGFEDDLKNVDQCPEVRCCQESNCSQCSSCEYKIEEAIGSALNVSGWTGMFFSFTEVCSNISIFEI